jgi:hypothetical protein
LVGLVVVHWLVDDDHPLDDVVEGVVVVH